MNGFLSKIGTFFITLSLIALLEYLFFQNTKFINDLNSNIIDSAFLYRGEIKTDKRIVIIDVDERSLNKLGQWPWSRDKIAKILQNLTDANVAIIGLDMVFAEEDRTSPSKFANEFHLKDKTLPDYDKILAKTLSTTPTIIGFSFDFFESFKSNPPINNAIYIEHNKDVAKEELFRAKGATTNIKLLQESAYSSGSFNTLPDSDSVVRYVPLLFSYDDSIYPSLSFEIVRALLGVNMVDIYYDENGVSGIKVGDLEIPTDERGRLFVNYAGGAKSYRYISAVDVYNNHFKRDQIDGAIALVGISAAGLLDLRATPFDSVYPGVEVHANAIDNLINANIISSPSYVKSFTLIQIALVIIISALIITFANAFFSFILLLALFGIEIGYFYHMLFDEKIVTNVAYAILSTISTIFVLTLIKVYSENRQKMQIQKTFAKKVSPQVAQKLLKNSKDAFSISEVEVTIFFSDIRNFTTISEGFDNPKLLIEYLNEYMSPMSQIIIENEGTIDKYIGDAIMAYWNAPLPVKDHADKALKSALLQLEAIKELNHRLTQKGLPLIDIGIGIHTGEAIAGEMGSKGRSDYTVIGDSINLGSRIEGLCKKYGVKILISHSTKESLKERYKIREVDRVQVKGKDEAVTIYEVLGFGKFSKDELAVEEIYQEAKKLYRQRNFKEAYREFYRAFELSGSKLFAIYMDRSMELQKSGDTNILEVYRFDTK